MTTQIITSEMTVKEMRAAATYETQEITAAALVKFLSGTPGDVYTEVRPIFDADDYALMRLVKADVIEALREQAEAEAEGEPGTIAQMWAVYYLPESRETHIGA